MTSDVAQPDPSEVGQLLTLFHGGLAFDVGGNVGVVARQLSRQFDRVISCEPADESYDRLKRGAPDNVLALNVAVTAIEGPVTLAVNEHHIKTGQLSSKFHDDEYDQTNQGGWGRVIGT